MFHFGALDDVHRVSISVIDWGRVSKPKENIHSHYAIQDKADRRRLLALRRWVDPSLVFIKFEHRSQATVPIHMQDTKAWALFEIAQMIWGAVKPFG